MQLFLIKTTTIFFYDYSEINQKEGSTSSKDVIKINKKCFVYAETYYMLRFVQIRNNRYENRLIFLLLANKNIVFP